MGLIKETFHVSQHIKLQSFWIVRQNHEKFGSNVDPKRRMKTSTSYYNNTHVYYVCIITIIESFAS